MTEDHEFFPAYRYIDTAFGGVQKRNKVVSISELSVPPETSDCYTTMFRFPEEYLDHCRNTGSVSKTSHLSCYTDFLWFDIDDKDLERALVHARAIVARIERIPGPEITVALYFSGAKGFHIGVPAALFGFAPSPDLPAICKEMAVLLAGETPIDGAIYDHNRLWRVPNTRHGKSGLYKTRLTVEELKSMSVEEIKKRAARPGGSLELMAPHPENRTVHPKLALLYREAKEVIGKRAAKKQCVQADRGGTKPCITALERGVSEGLRNGAAHRLADHYRKEGLPQDYARELLLRWNSRNDPPMDEDEVLRTCDSSFTGDYDYGCNDELLASHCDPSCALRSGRQSPKRLSEGRLLPSESVAGPRGGLAQLLAGVWSGRYGYVRNDITKIRNKKMKLFEIQKEVAKRIRDELTYRGSFGSVRNFV